MSTDVMNFRVAVQNTDEHLSTPVCKLCPDFSVNWSYFISINNFNVIETEKKHGMVE